TSAGLLRLGRRSESEREAADDGARVARRKVDFAHALGRLPRQPRGGGELRLAPLDIGEVLDGDEGVEGEKTWQLLSIPRPHVEDRVALRGLGALLVGEAIADIAHGRARREAPGQA